MRRFGPAFFLVIFCLAGLIDATAATTASDITAPLDLTRAWKFRRGDDRSWATAETDDPEWSRGNLEDAFSIRHFDEFSGATWFRTDVDVASSFDGAAARGDLAVAFGPAEYSGYDVYAGDQLIGHFGSTQSSPHARATYAEVFRIPADAVDSNGRVVLALRLWRNPAYAGGATHDFEQHGPFGPFAIGSYADLRDRIELARLRARGADIPMVLCACIFALVGLYHLQLSSKRRQLREYLWFGLLALVASVNVFFASSWTDDSVPRFLAGSIALAALHLNSAIWIEFVWALFGWRIPRYVRAYEVLQLVLALATVAVPELTTSRLGLWPIYSLAPVLVIWFVLIPREAWRGNPTARTICFGLVFLASARFYQFIAVFHIVAPFNVTHWGFAALILSMAVSLSNRFAGVYARIDGLNQELEEKVVQRTVELDHTIARLQSSEHQAVEAREAALSASAAKSVFLANISHELRTPLNAILGFVQLMKRDRSLGRTSHERLDVISRSGEHLLGLINDILSISKIEAGRASLEVRPFALRRTLAGLDDLFRLRAETKRIELRFDVDPGLPDVVRGDEAKLRQVLTNLLGNAVKFTDEGSVVLRAKWAENRALFEVVDTGCGIDERDFPLLFVPFTQTQAGRDAKEGTGLGLSISRDIVGLMDGNITVRSKVGVGTTFSFDCSLPASELLSEESESRIAVGLEEGQPEFRILVTDDSADNRDLLVALMESVGFAVRSVANGAEAVRAWETWRPHLIWMDVRMPVMDGIEATREIRARSEPIDACVIVALTASVFEQDRAELLAAGCDDFIPKPFRAEALFDAIAQRLGVRFVYESVPLAQAQSNAERRGQRDHGGVSSGWKAELGRVVMQGDVEGANAVIAEIDDDEPTLAGELRRLVRAYRFDEVQRVLERTPPAPQSPTSPSDRAL